MFQFIYPSRRILLTSGHHSHLAPLCTDFEEILNSEAHICYPSPHMTPRDTEWKTCGKNRGTGLHTTSWHHLLSGTRGSLIYVSGKQNSQSTATLNKVDMSEWTPEAGSLVPDKKYKSYYKTKGLFCPNNYIVLNTLFVVVATLSCLLAKTRGSDLQRHQKCRWGPTIPIKYRFWLKYINFYYTARLKASSNPSHILAALNLEQKHIYLNLYLNL